MSERAAVVINLKTYNIILCGRVRMKSNTVEEVVIHGVVSSHFVDEAAFDIYTP